MKHTPGPWCANFPQGNLNYVITDKPLLMLPGADALDTTALAIVYSTDMKTKPEANAHLIAAAPDLLWVCKQALEILQVQPDLLRTDTGERGDGELGEIVPQLDHVIKQAEGTL